MVVTVEREVVAGPSGDGLIRQQSFIPLQHSSVPAATVPRMKDPALTESSKSPPKCSKGILIPALAQAEKRASRKVLGPDSLNSGRWKARETGLCYLATRLIDYKAANQILSLTKS